MWVGRRRDKCTLCLNKQISTEFSLGRIDFDRRRTASTNLTQHGKGAKCRCASAMKVCLSNMRSRKYFPAAERARSSVDHSTNVAHISVNSIIIILSFDDAKLFNIISVWVWNVFSYSFTVRFKSGGRPWNHHMHHYPSAASWRWPSSRQESIADCPVRYCYTSMA